MNIRATFVMATALLLANQMAHANAACDKYVTSYDKTYCVAKLFLESDKDLNAVYTDLRARLKGPAQKQLVLVQREWIKYRDQTCEPQAGTINVDCNHDVNMQRASYLRERLLECKAGICREDLITRPSW